MTELMCSACKEWKDEEDFARMARGKRGRQYNCRSCTSIRMKKWSSTLSQEQKEARYSRSKSHRKENPEHYRWKNIERMYNLTQDQFHALLDGQGNLCAICKTDRPGGRYNRWCIDHDHRCCSGVNSCGDCVRGILCVSCNWALGALKDDVNSARNLVLYLECD